MTETKDNPRPTSTWLREGHQEMLANGKPGEKLLSFNAAVVAEYRATGGASLGDLPREKVGIITTKGARSGVVREVPLGFEKIEGRLFVIATKGGLPTHPQWYYNLLADPLVVVEYLGERYEARAVQLEAAERDRIFGQLAGNYQNYAERIAGVREIPVFELHRLN